MNTKGKVYITEHANDFGHTNVMITYYKNGELDWSTRKQSTGSLNSNVEFYTKIIAL